MGRCFSLSTRVIGAGELRAAGSESAARIRLHGFSWALTITFMNRTALFSLAGFLIVAPSRIAMSADDFKPEPGYASLFNGKDLTGWGYKTNHFDGKTGSSDGRYTAKDGILVVNPKEPRLMQILWTTREFPKDFVLKLEFRAAVNADSGIFIRKPQLQCRDYPIAGPYKELKKYKPQGWNEIEVTVKDGVAHCTCNGEVLEDALKVPDTGPIGLEADRGQMEYRRIRLKELP
jgi:hypothetical protein